MHRKFLYLIIITLLFSCTNKKEILVQNLTKNEISGAVLWNRIYKESSYLNYAYMPGQEGLNPGQSPHGIYHKIFINQPLLNGLPSDSGSVPYGSIIVKENYSTEQELDKLTVMAKVEGYNPEGGDWFWAAISPKGEVLAEGVPAGCFSCHSGVKDNDYIIVHNISDKL